MSERLSRGLLAAEAWLLLLPLSLAYGLYLVVAFPYGSPSQPLVRLLSMLATFVSGAGLLALWVLVATALRDGFEALRRVPPPRARLIHVGGAGSLEVEPGVLLADRLPADQAAMLSPYDPKILISWVIFLGYTVGLAGYRFLGWRGRRMNMMAVVAYVVVVATMGLVQHFFGHARPHADG